MSSAERRRRRRRTTSLPASMRERFRSRAASEDGFLLIEVMVSVLLVGLIAVATFNGFDVANRMSADQRRHSEAELLAAQSQEQLRSDPATALDALESASHTYTQTVNGTEFTITQEAKPVSASGSSTGCNFSESSTEHGANILITSSVTWSLLTKAKRPAVKQASVVTPPIGSAIEVDVSNGGSPPQPQAAITAIASFVPEEGVTTNHAEGTTGAAGCVVLSGLAATTATVEIAKHANYVTTGSLLQFPTKEVTIVPNLTTQYPVTYAEGARLKAEFTYKGLSEFEKQVVTGDTFVVTNSSIPAGYTKWTLGGTNFEFEKGGEEEFKFVAGAYGSTALTPAGSQYTRGDLFPFPSGWTGYAGDCPKNDVSAEAESTASALKPGETGPIKIPLSYTKLNVYTGTQTKPGSLTATSYPATITNTECEGYEEALHAFGTTLKHTQNTNVEGHLSAPFQPFGKANVCVLANSRTYTIGYNNATAAGSTKSVYLGEITNAEKAAARKKEEEENKAKRIAEEKTAREAKEATEATEKTANLKLEAEEIAKWKKQEEKGEITSAQRKSKEKTYKENREKAEATKKETREKEEAAAKKAAEEAEKIANTKKQTEETEEIAKKEVTVGTGSC